MNALTELRSLFTITADGKQCVFTEQLDRATYKKVADILERLEGKWNKKAGAFVFPFDAKSMIEEVFGSGQIPKRNPLQFHPTPYQQVVDMLDSSERLHQNLMFGAAASGDTTNIRVLEPSIGRMGIANVIKARYPHVKIVGCELDEVNAKIAAEAGYDVTQGDFLDMPIPQTEEERFDAVVMNPPFMGRGFIKHILHAQKMLKKKGVLVSVIPSEWMKSARSDIETDFLDEITRCSSELTTEYEKGTYESTDITTRIIEMMHKDDYAKLVEQNKEYWIHQNVIELENEYDFRVKFDAAHGQYKKALLSRELVNRRNLHQSPSVVEWVDEVFELLVNDEAPIAKVDNQHLVAKEIETVDADNDIAATVATLCASNAQSKAAPAKAAIASEAKITKNPFAVPF